MMIITDYTDAIHKLQFTELMKKGSVQVGDVSKVLCEDLSR